ncbi:hypothetical protein [Streptomyces roseolus]|uniref:hypothetical protein n=1 Tax=Streptomyces roseolus TaxID=67358 RepID=UPI00167AA0FD|nr:hypothetical protein [Streptomyces roseolus]GGR52128.1 hypothetical protein GCM10010282_51430 [Streptomyces roseolus]
MPKPKKAATAAVIADGYTADEAIEIAEALQQEEPPVVDHRLRETGNGPTVSYEEGLLREIYGEPDAEGVYR